MRIQRILILLLVSFFSSCVFAQTVKMEDKIDPVFKSLIAEAEKDQPVKKKSCLFKKKVKNNAINETKYSCVVYTTNPQALKDNGILVQSILPKFVTALATLEQIKKMAALPDVTYIEAPQKNELH